MNSKINQKYYEEIIANLPGHIYWKDKQGKFLGCNLQQARDAGYHHSSDMIGKTDYDMPWRRQADYLREIDLKVMKSGRPISIEEISEIAGGHKRVYLSNKLPLYDDYNQIAGILGISIDITENKKLQDDLIKAKKLAESANLAKTEFLENMRHDIRTPLTGIVGFAQIIRDESSNFQIKEYSDNLIAASYALLEFLNDILEGIKVFTTEMPIAKCKFNLRELTKKLVDLFVPKAMEKGLNLSLTIDDSRIPNFVIGDPKRIQRIILELVSNALNFTEKGTISIKFELAKKQDKEMVLQLEIKDTGIGIPKERQEEVFLRFKRLVPSYKGLYKGSGLGLAIVKQFVDDLKGEIYCQNNEEKGTTFICLLPLGISLMDNETGAFDIKELELKTSIIKPPRDVKQIAEEKGLTQVLLVEDQILAAKVAQSIISKLDCNVDHAVDGKSALKFLQEKDYDLIFMDVGLPDISGIDLTKQIRTKEWQQEEHVPIVALTAHIDSENKKLCIYSGMDAVLSKPLKSSTAKDIINAFVPSRHVPLEKVISDDKKSLLTLSGEILDAEESIEKMGGDIEAAREMMGLLTQSLNEELPKLIAAKEKNDWNKIKSISHKLRGGCAYCGVQRLREACTTLEDYLLAQKTKWRDELFVQLVNEINNVLKFGVL